MIVYSCSARTTLQYRALQIKTSRPFVCLQFALAAAPSNNKLPVAPLPQKPSSCVYPKLSCHPKLFLYNKTSGLYIALFCFVAYKQAERQFKINKKSFPGLLRGLQGRLCPARRRRLRVFGRPGPEISRLRGPRQRL